MMLDVGLYDLRVVQHRTREITETRKKHQTKKLILGVGGAVDLSEMNRT